MFLKAIRIVILTIVLTVIHAGISAAQTSSDLLIWFDKPADNFTQSLPLGNGRLGAMVFGDVKDELIILNEGSDS
jgi:alpha-L-fucosidase 2